MPPRHNYTYRSLYDAFQGHRPSLVNVYAIVTEWTMPRATRGTDYHVVLKVLDPSVASLTTEQNDSYTDVSINFFASKELLPKPRKVGDIIRVHRLVVKNYNGRTQFVAKIGMIGGGGGAGGTSRCHYCLFDGKASKNKKKTLKEITSCTIQESRHTHPPSQPIENLPHIVRHRGRLSVRTA